MEEKNTRREFLCVMASLLLAPLVVTQGHCEAVPPQKPGRPAKKREAAPRQKGGASEPAYVAIQRSGALKERGQRLWEIMNNCRLCPRQCGADRISGRRGFCNASAALEIASYHAHFGEEQELVGAGGSGTVFFSNCSLRCVFCINWEVSQGDRRTTHSIEELAAMMLALQRRGCHNINVVTPTHYSPHILLALDHAVQKGLRLPVVYNTCGWENLEILKALDGVVDIYMPDFKYGESDAADRYSSGASSYPQLTQTAIKEMHRQVGTARPATDGMINRGLIIRHLVMPNRVAHSETVIRWIAQNLPKDTYVNLMSQYTPVFKAHQYPEIARRITAQEYRDVIAFARNAGLTNVRTQGVPW